MIKAPAKFKKSMMASVQKFIEVIAGKAKSGVNEEDTRIIINDMLGDVFGYDKYHDIKTELREKGDRFDYAIKLSEGPNAKKEKYDFIIEAKALSTELKEQHVEQTLKYCLQANIDYFILTNAKHWQLYKVINTKKTNEAKLIFETDFGKGADANALIDEMYAFSKHAYLEKEWDFIAKCTAATDAGDVMAVIMSDKFLASIVRALKDYHEVDVNVEAVKETLTKKIFKDGYGKLNKKFYKELNEVKTKKKKDAESSEGTLENNVLEMSVVMAEQLVQNGSAVSAVASGDEPPPVPEEFKRVG
jgi:hypothetical protein